MFRGGLESRDVVPRFRFVRVARSRASPGGTVGNPGRRWPPRANNAYFRLYAGRRAATGPHLTLLRENCRARLSGRGRRRPLAAAGAAGPGRRSFPNTLVEFCGF